MLPLPVNSSFVVWNNFGTEMLSESSQIRLENESEKETTQNHELNAYRYIVSKSQSFLRNLWTGLKLRSINCLRLKPIFEHYCWIFFVEKWKIQYENALSKYFQACSQKYWQLPLPLLVNQFNLVLPAPNAAHIVLFCRFENPISLRLIKRDSFTSESIYN